jgi:hypothetical protein
MNVLETAVVVVPDANGDRVHVDRRAVAAALAFGLSINRMKQVPRRNIFVNPQRSGTAGGNQLSQETFASPNQSMTAFASVRSRSLKGNRKKYTMWEHFIP